MSDNNIANQKNLQAHSQKSDATFSVSNTQEVASTTGNLATIHSVSAVQHTDESTTTTGGGTTNDTTSVEQNGEELSGPEYQYRLPQVQNHHPQSENAPITIDEQLETENESAPVSMRVTKRNGRLELADVNKIVNVVIACSNNLNEVDPMRVAAKVISGLYDGATTTELDELCIQTASHLIAEEPEYSKLAARLMARFLREEVTGSGIHTFFNSITKSHECGLISDKKYKFIKKNKEAFNLIVDDKRTELFEYFGLRTVYDRYLLKDPNTSMILETPQYFFLRVACGLAENFKEAKEFYDLISQLDYMTSSPTLFNTASNRPQLSSCYLVDSPEDSLHSIYDRYSQVAKLSKFAGGIGISYSKVRSRGSLIQGTGGRSNGLVPWLKTLDSSVVAVNQGGRRKGAACVYLETWHGDIEEFLQLRDNTGDEAQRTHNINLANWVPDLFMKRVEADAEWSLFSPSDVPHFVNLYGEEFEKAYLKAELDGLATKTVQARSLYSRMMKTLAQTGNGWMNFKDSCNVKCNQTGQPENVVHLSNLCTEIVEVTSNKEIAVCNLGSVNLPHHCDDTTFDFEKLAETVRAAVKYLDRVIDINFYPVDEASKSNSRWRPVGLGLMGLQDVFFKMNLPFDSEKALELSTKISEEIYYHALSVSCDLAEKQGAHAAFKDTRAAQGVLQFDAWGVTPTDTKRWDALKKRIKKVGLRNSLLIAIAPTATIGTIVGSHEAMEPQVSNLFKKETLSGEFIQMNRYLVRALKKRKLWNADVRNQIKEHDGSIQRITVIPQDLKDVYKTAWELPQKALIDMAAARGAFIDQSQSLNLFMETPTIGKLSSMYMYAWKQGLKTTYYLRSRPATSIAKITTRNSAVDEAAVACSLENPESCESCQ